MEKTLNLIKNDPWLEPFADAIAGRHQFVLDKEAELTNKGAVGFRFGLSLFWIAPYCQRLDFP